MPRPTEAIHPVSWVETLFVVAFLAGAVWAGKRVGEVYQIEAIDIVSKNRRVGQIGAEWNQIRVFEAAPSIEAWAERQKGLNRRLAAQAEHVFDPGKLYQVFPAYVYQLSRFDDYALRPSLPLPGSVYQLEQGPKCVKFVWTQIPVEGVRYTLEVAKTRNFAFYRSFGSETNSLRIQANTKGEYFWRVKAEEGRNQTSSELSTFQVLEPNLTPEQKRLRDLAARVKDPNAWLADLQFCR